MSTDNDEKGDKRNRERALSVAVDLMAIILLLALFVLLVMFVS